jgi:hypothetical protein
VPHTLYTFNVNLFRSGLLAACEAGANKAELARALGVSRQRVDEVLTCTRHERGGRDRLEPAGREHGSSPADFAFPSPETAM